VTGTDTYVVTVRVCCCGTQIVSLTVRFSLTICGTYTVCVTYVGAQAGAAHEAAAHPPDAQPDDAHAVPPPHD
jgi:hypothetical protein